MAKILVSGLMNIETTVKVDRFPVEYTPVRFPFFGIRSCASGVGYNIARALTSLGHKVTFLSLIEDDSAGIVVRAALQNDAIDDRFVLDALEATPESVILYDDTGRRAIFTDLKDVQDHDYPVESFEQAVQNCELAALCNVNFSRALLSKTKALGIPIATDVHAIDSLDDEYNADFMRHADILFMSDEKLPVSPEEWAKQLQARYQTSIIVIGLGGEGALLAVRDDGRMERVPSRTLRDVTNTVGAGDSLFSAFVHSYMVDKDPYRAIRKAVIFAGYKIGETSGSEGFLTADRLDEYYHQLHSI